MDQAFTATLTADIKATAEHPVRVLTDEEIEHLGT